MKKPFIIITTTDFCNHNCHYCAKQRHDIKQKLDISYEYIDKILSIDKRLLGLTGGEPALVKDKIFYIMERETAPILLNTNLVLWTPEEIEYLSSKATINVSVPSLDKDIYESIMNANTFDALCANLEILPRKNTITIVVGESTIPTLEETVRQLRAMMFSTIYTIPSYGTPRGAQKDALVKAIQEMHEKDINLITNSGPMDDHGNRLQYTHQCCAGSKRIGVLTNGDVVPCPVGHPNVIGHIMTDDIATLMQRGMDFSMSYPEAERHLCKGYSI